MTPSKIIAEIDRWATMLLVYLIPWQARFIFEQGFLAGAPSEARTRSLFLIEALIWPLVAIRIGRLAREGSFNKYFTKLSGRDRILFAFAALVFVAFFSTVISLDRSATLVAALRFVEGLAVFFLIITSASFHEMRLAFFASALVSAAIGIVQVLGQQIHPSSWLGVAAHYPETLGTSVVEGGGMRFLRAYGTLPHPNILGGMLVVAILSSRSLFKRFSVASAGTYAMLAIGLFFTFSRSAWIALALGLLAQWMWARRDAVFIKNPAVVAATMLVLAAAFYPLVRSRAAADGRLEARSVAMRVASLKDAAAVIARSPLVGSGAGAFTVAVREWVDEKRSGFDLEPPHNAFLAAFAEIGAFGSLLFVWLICLLVVSAWRCGKIGLAVALITLAFFDHWAWTTFAGILVFWTGWGLTMRGCRENGITHKAGAIVLSHGDPSKALLLYRSGPNYCDWTFPKGHQEPGESREDTMRREVKEETGLDIEMIRPLPDRKYTTGHNHPAIVHFFLARSLDDSKLRLEPGFLDNRLEWVDISEVADRLTFDNLKGYFNSVRHLLRLP